VLVCTLPPFLLAAHLLVASILEQHRTMQYADWYSRDATSARALRSRIESILRLPRTLWLESGLTPEDTPGAVHVVVDPREWSAVRGAPQDRSRRADAWLVRGLDRHPAELRLRGDTSVHWTTEKESIQLRTKKDELVLGRRRLVFTVKEPLASFTALALARHVGLVTPPTDIVPLFLGRRYHGVVRATAPIDEGFLRRSGLLPGNVFRGEVVARGERYRGLPANLFAYPLLWDRCAKNDRPGAPPPTLAPWLRDLNGETPGSHRRFMARLDREEIALLLAFLLAIGDPIHMDDTHNQFWYEDPASARLRPVPWDLGLRHLPARIEGVGLNRFWRTVLRDPRVFARALERVHAWRESGELVDAARDLLDDVLTRHGTAIELDLLRSGRIPRLRGPENIVATLQANLDHVAERTRDARVGLAVTRTAPGTWVVDLETRSWAGVRLVGLEAPGGVLSVSTTSPAEDGGTGLPQEGHLPAGVDASAGIEPAPLSYRWFVRTAPEAETLEPTLVNAVTGAPALIEPWEAGAPVSETRSWHPWTLDGPPRAATALEWSGTVHLEQDHVVPAGSTLTLAPGTRVLFEPDVSLLVRGRLDARGTADRPVVLTGTRPDRPWGTLALQGEGASGSRLAHARITGGGGALIDRVEYKGMVSIHAARDVRLERCELADNLRCDDLLYAIGAEVDLLDCHFHDALADAIDYDLSTGRIEGCTIEDAGNDGLDLMTSRPRVAGNTIRSCADKGISVGEDAAPLVEDNRILGCDIGVEVKDGSRPLLVRNEITGGRLGVLARHKNWRYPNGGWPLLVGSLVAGNGIDLDLLDDARVTDLARIGGEAGGGAVPAWLVGPWEDPSLVVASETFADDFRTPEREWEATNGVRALVKRDGDLVATLRAEPGRRERVGRPLELELATGATLVVELAAEGLAGVRVLAVPAGGGDPLAVDCALAGGPRSYAFTTLALPAGRYEGLLFELENAHAQAAFRLHGWSVVAPSRRR
jgi:hypothetical protein